MTRTSPSVLAVFFLLLSLCLMQGIGAVPVEPDVKEDERHWGYWYGEPDTDKPMDQIVLDSFGGPAGEKAAEEARKKVGVVTVGMDTLLTPEQAAILHQTPEGGMTERRQPTFVTLWPGGVVPYDLSTLSFIYHDMMLEAFREWEDKTCVRFVPAQPHDLHRIFFTDDDGCSSFLGMKEEPQPISLAYGCNLKRTYLHELGHALGLVHEHQLPQRDNYIYVETRNVKTKYLDQVEKFPASVIPDAEMVAYSLSSIMHYGKYAFSKGDGLQTLFAKDQSQEHLMGTSRQLTPSDIEVVNLLYNCNNFECIDINLNCDDWVLIGYCRNLPVDVVMENCPKACSLC